MILALTLSSLFSFIVPALSVATAAPGPETKDSVKLEGSVSGNGTLTVTATNETSGSSNTSCADDCCLQTSSNRAAFTFENSSSIVFLQDDGGTIELAQDTTGSSATFTVAYYNGSSWGVDDPTITVQTGVCTGSRKRS